MNVTERTILAVASILIIIAAACGTTDDDTQTIGQDAATATHSPELTPKPESTLEPTPTSETEPQAEPTPAMDADRIAGDHCTEARSDGEQEILRRHPDRDELKFMGFQIDSVDSEGKHRMLIEFMEPNEYGGFKRGIARFSVNNPDCVVKILEVKY